MQGALKIHVTFIYEMISLSMEGVVFMRVDGEEIEERRRRAKVLKNGSRDQPQGQG